MTRGNWKDEMMAEELNLSEPQLPVYRCSTGKTFACFTRNWWCWHPVHRFLLMCERWFWGPTTGNTGQRFNNRKHAHTKTHTKSTKGWKYLQGASCTAQCICNPQRIACRGGTTMEVDWDEAVYPPLLDLPHCRRYSSMKAAKCYSGEWNWLFWNVKKRKGVWIWLWTWLFFICGRGNLLQLDRGSAQNVSSSTKNKWWIRFFKRRY